MKPNTGKRSPHIPKARLALADAHMAINGCQVFVGHPDPARAQRAAKGFKDQLSGIIARARIPNMSDMYSAHLQMDKGLKDGKSIKEIIE